MFQMYYKSDAHLVFKGIFVGDNGYVVADKGMNINYIPNAKDEETNRAAALNMKRLFKYPSFKHPGEFDEK